MVTKRHATNFVFATLLIWAWAGGLVFAGNAMVKESNEPGNIGRVPVLWPHTALLARHSQLRPTLVLALHPKCGCSAATVAELGKLINDYPDRLDVQVLVRQPTSETWEPSARETTLSTLPGVTLLNDHGGIEAERFGALTSGQVVLFDVKGRELFAGGLTAIRGHEGPSLGTAAIAEYLKSGQSKVPTSSVFGCALSDPHPRVESYVAEVRK